MHYLIITPRNLEDISQKELEDKKIKIIRKYYRKLLVEYQGNPIDLYQLRAPDDVLIFLNSFSDTLHFDGKLDNLYKEIKKVNLSQAINLCKKVRLLSKNPTFSVTAPIAGKRKFSQDYLKQIIAKAIKNNNLQFKKEGKHDLDFSLIIDNKNVFF